MDIDMHLRFQVPPSVLPLKLERARLFLNINGLTHRLTIAGHAEGGLVELLSVEKPTDPIQLDVVRESLLHLDPQGGLHLNVAVNEMPKEEDSASRKASEAVNWTIETLGLEVVGRTLR